MSFNLYAYCMNNPDNYVDRGGNDVYYFYDEHTFNEKNELLDVKNATTDRSDIISDLGYEPDEVRTVTVGSRDEFVNEWNSMKDEKIDAVIIYTHAGPGAYQFGYEARNLSNPTSPIVDETKYKAEEYTQSKADAGNDLQKKDINMLVSLGCNTGNVIKLKNEELCKTSRFMPEFFMNELGIKYVVAANGNTLHSDVNDNHVISVEDYQQMYMKNYSKNPPEYDRIIPKTYDGYFKLFHAGGDIQMYDKYLNAAQLIRHAQGLEISIETQ